MQTSSLIQANNNQLAVFGGPPRNPSQLQVMSNNYTGAGASASTVLMGSHSSIIADTPMINNYHGVANKPKVGGLIS